MPLRGTPSAPKFDGSARDLIRYFEDVSQLANAANLTPAQAIKACLRYIHRDDAGTWETLEETGKADFDKFVDAVKTLYPGCESDKQYMRADLEFLVNAQTAKPMQLQDDVGAYLRQFCRVSTFLIKKKCLAENEHDRLFLEGFHPDIQTRIRRRLEIKEPDLHPDDAYTQASVLEAALFLLQGSTPLQAQSISPSPNPAAQPVQRTFAPSTPPPASPSIVVKQEYVLSESRPPPICYFCGRTGHTTKMCRDIDTYMASGKVAQTSEGRVVLADGSRIPTVSGTTMKDQVDIIVTERRLREVSSHAVAGLFVCSGPEIDIELDIESSAFLQTQTTNEDKGEEDPDVTMVHFKTPASPNTSVPASNSKSFDEIVSPQVKDANEQAKPHVTQVPRITAAPNAQYSHYFLLEDPTARKRVLDSVMQTTVPIPIQDILSIAPELRKQFKDQTTT
ncbi:uncharacterized protein EDB91DRAFT_1257711 [Suillus paluster]|uniref:uncharacterized protein n=1 Tax=Suillus paluster TaxID=48578 RepID=UPI001B85F2AA|nr:uncharacterized protein EDB91DRAFT_1257711 [Suillus paluster]KAG1719382.1 hypothetical protein EDB91DRAFT_1257711 [Suillus paluster]